MSGNGWAKAVAKGATTKVLAFGVAQHHGRWWWCYKNTGRKSISENRMHESLLLLCC